MWLGVASLRAQRDCPPVSRFRFEARREVMLRHNSGSRTSLTAPRHGLSRLPVKSSLSELLLAAGLLGVMLLCVDGYGMLAGAGPGRRALGPRMRTRRRGLYKRAQSSWPPAPTTRNDEE
jgi:hypothetical protein